MPFFRVVAVVLHDECMTAMDSQSCMCEGTYFATLLFIWESPQPILFLSCQQRQYCSVGKWDSPSVPVPWQSSVFSP